MAIKFLNLTKCVKDDETIKVVSLQQGELIYFAPLSKDFQTILEPEKAAQELENLFGTIQRTIMGKEFKKSSH